MQSTAAYHTDYIHEANCVHTVIPWLFKLISGKSTSSEINITILLLRVWGVLCTMDEFNTAYTSTRVLIKKTPLKFMMWRKDIKKKTFYFSTREIVYKGARFMVRLLYRNMSVATRINREDEGNIASVNDKIYDMICVYVLICNSEAGSDLASWTLLRWSYLLIHCIHSVYYCSQLYTCCKVVLILLRYVAVYSLRNLLFVRLTWFC